MLFGWGNYLKKFSSSKKITMIYVDNKSAITLGKNPIHHEHSKHINALLHFIREHVKENKVELIHVRTSD